MENLHLKNLKNIPNISEFYLKQVEKILDTKTNIIDYALKTTIRNPELEKFKVNFLKYYTDDNYLPYKDLLAFWRFTQIVTELNNADIGTDISKTTIFQNYNFIYKSDGTNEIFFTFSFTPTKFAPPTSTNISIYVVLNLKNGVIQNITVT